MRTVWLVVANSSIAKIYSASEEERNLKIVKQMEHPASKLKEHDLVTDKPGRYSAPNLSKGAFVSDSDPKELEMEKFARELVHELKQGLQNKSYSALIISASQKFYGLLNKHLPDAVRDKVEEVLQKDYTPITLQELEEIFSPIYRYIFSDKVGQV